MFAPSKSLTKIENFHKRALRLMLDDNSSSYERLLEHGKFFMDVKRKHKLCIEMYKALHNLNPSFAKEISEPRLCSRCVREQ